MEIWGEQSRRGKVWCANIRKPYLLGCSVSCNLSTQEAKGKRFQGQPELPGGLCTMLSYMMRTYFINMKTNREGGEGNGKVMGWWRLKRRYGKREDKMEEMGRQEREGMGDNITSYA